MIAMLVDARCFEPKFGARQPITRQEFADVHRPGEASRNGLASARTQAPLGTVTPMQAFGPNAGIKSIVLCEPKVWTV
jgi:hypothetical protein